MPYDPDRLRCRLATALNSIHEQGGIEKVAFDGIAGGRYEAAKADLVAALPDRWALNAIDLGSKGATVTAVGPAGQVAKGRGDDEAAALLDLAYKFRRVGA